MIVHLRLSHPLGKPLRPVSVRSSTLLLRQRQSLLRLRQSSSLRRKRLRRKKSRRSRRNLSSGLIAELAVTNAP
jgi:hypothetical protein